MPCRNEGKHLSGLIRKIVSPPSPQDFDEIICVSNCSTDNTLEVGAVLEKEIPCFRMLQDDRAIGGIGYGYAHMTGIAAATGEIIVCADCDGTYPVEDVALIVDIMDKQGLSFVSCCRYPDSGIAPMLQLGVKLLNAEIRLLYGYRIQDSLSGMWVFKKSVVPDLRLSAGDWNLSPQIKLNAFSVLGKKAAEVKIHQLKRYGQTKQNYVRTGLGHAWWIAKNRFASSR
ncbi:glycosyltransferase family 2 protein [Bifidobacterium xylocopae]|nr:glycosyltransferase family 2 protein [Bifidobacterium xylocopae]